MTKQQIKAELRRSACEDDFPNFTCDFHAYLAALEFCKRNGFGKKHPMNLRDDIRTFFLLVAKAL